jgi:osmotically-inducible protein OsmY
LFSLAPTGTVGACAAASCDDASTTKKTRGNTIHVDTSGGTVTLTGKASSWHVIEDAAAAAWAAPGVTKVIDTVSMSGF